MPSEPILSVEGVSKCYRLYDRPHHRLIEWASAGRVRRHRQHWALRDIGFSVMPGEILGIMGRNGAGKTTLLALLAGLLQPSAGRIQRSGTVSALINLGAGFDPNATGAENVRHLVGLLDGDAIDDGGIAAVAEFAELGEAMERPFRTYSAGMQLRLAFACATRRRADVLIIDEVMAVGDLFFRQKCHARIRELVVNGSAVVLVSHDYAEVGQFCDRAMVVESGGIGFLGGAREAVAHYLQSGSARNSPGQFESIVSSATGPAPSWPPGGACLDLSSAVITGCERARVVRLVVLRASTEPQSVFAFGETMRILIDIEALQDLATPIISWTLTDDHAQIVTGSASHLLPANEWPMGIPAGRRWRVSFDVGMHLRFGEYALGLGISDMPAIAYAGRRSRSPEEVAASMRRIGTVLHAAIVAVVPDRMREPTILTHHGVAAMPCQVAQGLVEEI
jgi:lipopolysaccharide transport system ATP-binding protein